MRKPAILVLMLLVILGQLPGFLRDMENKQTARCWVSGFAIALLVGCWIVCLLRPEL